MAFKVDEQVYAALAARCNQVDVGARQIDHILDQTVLPELSRRLLQKMTEETMPESVQMGVTEAGELTYSFSP